MTDIYMKFREDKLNGFQVKERTGFYNRPSSKGNNSKSLNARVKVIEWTQFCDKFQGK